MVIIEACYIILGSTVFYGVIPAESIALVLCTYMCYVYLMFISELL